MREKKTKNKKISSLSLMKYIIIITSVVHLVCSNIHINALLMLKNDMSGFVMFMFILLGLVLIFEATRVDGKKRKENVKLFVFSVIDLTFGVMLLNMYFSELGSIPKGGIGFVYQAIALGCGVCAMIVVTLGLNIYWLAKTK